MSERPGAKLSARPMYFFVLADCSGSMASDGKMHALNNAVREMLPHLVDIAAQNPHAEVLVRSIAFSTGAWWHVEEPCPVADLRWQDLGTGGYTDLGAALDLLSSQLRAPYLPERALPPAILLVSDGMPTDDFRPALGRFLDEPVGSRAVRMAVGIGRDADLDVLDRFVGSTSGAMSANNPEQLVQMIRWASTHASRVASSVAPWDPAGAGVVAEVSVDSPSEVVW
jgi:uncharacterized protein YegL